MPSPVHVLVLSIAAAASLLACRGPAVPAAANGTGGQTATQPAGGASTPGTTPVGRMTPTPQGATLTASKSQVVTVVFDGLATAGYEWNIVDGYDTRVVRLKGKRFGEMGPNPLIGASAQEIFDLEALAPGTTSVTFANTRSWEGRKPDSEVRTITVTVR